MTKSYLLSNSTVLKDDTPFVVSGKQNKAIISNREIMRAIVINRRFVDFKGSTIMFVLPTINCGYSIAVVKTSATDRFIGTNGRLCKVLYVHTGYEISLNDCLIVAESIYNRFLNIDKIAINTAYVSCALDALKARFNYRETKPLLLAVNSSVPPTINPQKIENHSTMAFMAFYQALIDDRMFLSCQTLDKAQEDFLQELNSLRVMESKSKRILIRQDDEYSIRFPLIALAIALAFVC